MCQVMGAYGYSIEQTLIVDVIPDATVRRAMNEINAGQFISVFSYFFVPYIATPISMIDFRMT